MMPSCSNGNEVGGLQHNSVLIRELGALAVFQEVHNGDVCLLVSHCRNITLRSSYLQLRTALQVYSLLNYGPPVLQDGLPKSVRC